MPATSTDNYEAFLAEHGLTLATLSERTRISQSRLKRLFLTGGLMTTEFDRLVAALGTEKAMPIVRKCIKQKGNFNQAGTGNRQHVTINNTYNFVIQVNTPNNSEPKALGGAPQHWEAQQLLPGGQVHQMGQPSSVQELGRAA